MTWRQFSLMAKKGRLRLNRIGKDRQYRKEASKIPAADVQYMMNFCNRMAQESEQCRQSMQTKGEYYGMAASRARRDMYREMAEWLLAIIKINLLCEDGQESESEQSSI